MELNRLINLYNADLNGIINLSNTSFMNAYGVYSIGSCDKDGAFCTINGTGTAVYMKAADLERCAISVKYEKGKVVPRFSDIVRCMDFASRLLDCFPRYHEFTELKGMIERADLAEYDYNGNSYIWFYDGETGEEFVVRSDLSEPFKTEKEDFLNFQYGE